MCYILLRCSLSGLCDNGYPLVTSLHGASHWITTLPRVHPGGGVAIVLGQAHILTQQADRLRRMVTRTLGDVTSSLHELRDPLNDTSVLSSCELEKS